MIEIRSGSRNEKVRGGEFERKGWVGSHEKKVCCAMLVMSERGRVFDDKPRRGHYSDSVKKWRRTRTTRRTTREEAEAEAKEQAALWRLL